MTCSLAVAACGSNAPTTQAQNESPDADSVIPTVSDDAAWLQELRAFRAAREQALRSPDSWFGLVGLHWLAEGKQRLGSGEQAQIRLAVGPAELGMITPEPDALQALLSLAEGAQVWLDGEPVLPGPLRLQSDKAEQPSRLEFEGGSLSLIERGGRFALRVRSPDSPSLQAFTGLAWFEPAAEYRVEARFEPHPADQTIPIVNILGQIENTPNPGRVLFSLNGQPYSLEALGDPDDALFLIFADRSNSRESYGGGRFLYTGPVQGDRVHLDFNRAINPPCAYTEFSTCPLPPPENRLPLPLRAGEARYFAGHAGSDAAS
ncbi:MAG: DUF1684 domain-containing protein [Aquimonas sp.]|nr:DUF1684 domain-containing protein [Aquimonas sp.]